MGLRLAEGIDLAALSARFGLAETELVDCKGLAVPLQQGLVWRDGSRLGVTEAGMPVLDALLGELVAESLLAA
jgi:oxygen-independent coproporphyrinogen-3 oxidase